jgi:predicted amidohydrolase
MSTSKTLRVALAQTCPLDAKLSYPTPNEDPFETLRANLADCVDFVKRAKEGGAEVVCFAEYYLQGILNEGRQVRCLLFERNKAHSKYLSLPSRYMEECIADLARKYEIAITGTIVHGTSTSLPSIPDVNPFVENSDDATKKWSEYFEQIQSEMANTDHLTLLNEAFFYDSTGKRRGTYVKKNLWHPER